MRRWFVDRIEPASPLEFRCLTRIAVALHWVYLYDWVDDRSYEQGISLLPVSETDQMSTA